MIPRERGFALDTLDTVESRQGSKIRLRLRTHEPWKGWVAPQKKKADVITEDRDAKSGVERTCFAFLEGLWVFHDKSIMAS